MEYADDICQENTFKYQNLRIVITNSAMRELFKYGKDLSDVLEILEKGKYAPRKRKKGTVEKWLQKRNKTYNAVIIRDYNLINQEECWVLTHFGRFTR